MFDCTIDQLTYIGDMFVRIKRNGSGADAREYLQIVESYREEGRIKQRVLCTLGRLDELRSSGGLDSLTRSLARYSENLRVLSAAAEAGIEGCQNLVWGPSLVFGRLWEKQGMGEILRGLARERKFGFDVDRTGFALALQRLCCPGSDLQGAEWMRTVIGLEGLELQHLYRTVAWLPMVRTELEWRLFQRDRDLFTQELDLVFLDTTSVFVYRDEETTWLKRGYSRDRHPELPQLVLCVAVDKQGWPVSWDVFPGNTADKAAFKAMIDKLRNRFHIGRIIVVADRGMISANTIDLLEKADAPFDYILGCRMRKQTEVNEEVLGRAGRYQKVADNLDVKEVHVNDHRYIICRNPFEAAKDAEAREDLRRRLEEIIAHEGPKSLMANRGYARFLKVKKGSLSIDDAALDADARLDGKFVLRTSTDLPADEVALAYKGLWRVERTFRKEKSTFEIRPVYHQKDGTTIGHIIGCFLALRLEVDLNRRLEERGIDVPWPNLMHDLDQLRAVHLALDGKTYRIRTDFQGHAHEAFLASGVASPPRLTEVNPL